MKSILFYPQQPGQSPTISRQCSRPCCFIGWVQLAPEHHSPDGPEDCYDAAERFVDNSEARFGDPQKVAGREVIRPVAHPTYQILLTTNSRLAPTSLHTPLSVWCSSRFRGLNSLFGACPCPFHTLPQPSEADVNERKAPPIFRQRNSLRG